MDITSTHRQILRLIFEFSGKREILKQIIDAEWISLSSTIWEPTFCIIDDFIKKKITVDVVIKKLCDMNIIEDIKYKNLFVTVMTAQNNDAFNDLFDILDDINKLTNIKQIIIS